MCARDDEQFSRCPCDNPLFKSFSGLEIEISAECIDERQFSGETLLNALCITKRLSAGTPSPSLSPDKSAHTHTSTGPCCLLLVGYGRLLFGALSDMHKPLTARCAPKKGYGV